MKSNNKGIALAYTLMMMLLVFAICAVITSIMLAQVASNNRYVNSAETESIYLKIGEIFCATQNDTDRNDFASALQNNAFTITSETDSNEWNVEFADHKLVLVFSTDADTDRNNLKIKNAAGTKTYLTVGVGITDGKLKEWTKGKD